MTEVANTYCQTFTGLYVNPLRLRVEDVRLEDIAHHLSLRVRWGGAVRCFYSVAEHSVRVAQILSDESEPPEVILRALLHDASETYLVDMLRPLKKFGILGDVYRPIEARVQTAVFEAFSLRGSAEDLPQIKAADTRMLATERRDLMPDDGVEWQVLRGVDPVEEVIVPLAPGRAEELFTSCVLATLAQVHGTLEADAPRAVQSEPPQIIEIYKNDSGHPTHYRCENCGSEFPMIGDTDKWMHCEPPTPAYLVGEKGPETYTPPAEG